MHVHALAWVSRQHGGSALEDFPRQGDDEPEAYIPELVYADEGKGLREFAIAAFGAENVEQVVDATECRREEHYANRHPSEVSIPIEGESDEGNSDDYQQAAHHRDTHFVAAGFERERWVVLALADDLVFV